MNKAEFYTEINKLFPIQQTESKPFPEYIKSLLQRYRDLVDQLDEREFQNPLKPKAIENIEKLINQINKAVYFVHCGKHVRAYDALDVIIGKTELCFHLFKTDNNHNFYRMRPIEEGVRFHRKDMFHIPNDMRTIVKTQRYSVPGYPCLYLGFSIQACWEEMHRPQIAKCMFNRFELVKDIRMLSLELPDEKQWSADSDRYLQIFPLILACMVQVYKPNDVYKPEYTIPQLLTEWIITHDNLKMKDVMGVSYTSVHINSDFNFPRKIYNNLAIPIRNVENGKYCDVVSGYFKLTEPTSEEIERIKVGSFNEVYDMDNDPIEENYRCSLFGMLEKALQSKEYPTESVI